MKDPLDDRFDPYQYINDVAREHDEDLVLSLDSVPRDIRFAMRLEDLVDDRETWDIAFDSLNMPNLRSRIDLFFYEIGEVDSTAGPVPAPSILLNTAPMPVISNPSQLLLQAEPLRQASRPDTQPDRAVTLHTLDRYDCIKTPTCYFQENTITRNAS